MKNKVKMTALPIALFIFSGSMLTLGKGGAAEWANLALAALLAALALPISCVAAESVFGQREKKGKEKTMFIVFSVISSLAAIYSAALMTGEFSDFVSNVMLLRISGALVSGIFVGFCAYLAGRGAEVIKKFALIAAVIVFACSLLLFVLSAPNLEWGRIRELFASAKEIKAERVVDIFSGSFAGAVIAVIYFAQNGGARGRSALWGVIFSLFLILICFLNVFLLLGGNFATSMEYPYATAVSTVTAGKLFARLEGFAYLTYYLSSALRVSVCISLVSTLINKKSRALPYALGALVFLVTLVLPFA